MGDLERALKPHAAISDVHSSLVEQGSTLPVPNHGTDPLEASITRSDRPLHAADLGFPSPANEDLITRPFEDEPTPGWNGPPSFCGIVPDSAIPQPVLPLTRTSTAANTPSAHVGNQTQNPLASHFESGLNIAGIADPTSSSDLPLPTPPIVKAGHNLRLPSFDLLGIAAPHPDRKQLRYEEILGPMGGGQLTGEEDGSSKLEDQLARHPGPPGLDGAADAIEPEMPELRSQEVRKTIHQYISTLTPPEEGRTGGWLPFGQVHTTGPAMDSPATDPEGTPTNTDHDSRRPSGSTEASSNAPSSQHFQAVEAAAEDFWLDGALKVLTFNLDSAHVSDQSLKVLSQALPCPSADGHAFPLVIDAIHQRIPPSPTVWINVFHAVPGRFNLADLPTSPPGTPGPAFGGDDYFTTKIFDSAVPVIDYQANATTVPRSRNPVVPPATVNVSIVERYIPPTSPNEFSEMFSVNGPSLLVDRLTELSARNGTLIFIYPTKRGAETFMKQYLSPILDPLLRTICVVNGLSADLSATLGHMESIDKMLDFEALRLRIQRLCRSMSRLSTSATPASAASLAPPSRTPHSTPSTYTLSYAAAETVPLAHKIWAEDWWVKQEKPRVRSAVSKYFRIAQRLPADSEVMPTNLIMQILDGVAHPQSRGRRGSTQGSTPGAPRQQRGKEAHMSHEVPTEDVEVGVFVIKRSG